MKRSIFALLVLTVILLVCVACSGETETTATATDTGTDVTAEQETTPIPRPPYRALHFKFDSYEELYPWFLMRSETAVVEYKEQLTGTSLGELAEDIRNGEKKLLIPYENQTPMPLTSPEAEHHVTIMSWDTFYRPRIWYHCVPTGTSEDERTIIKLTYLTDEEIRLAKSVSCSELIRTMWPMRFNTHNYQSIPSINRVYEDTVTLSDRTVSVLVTEYHDNPRLTVEFAYDGVLVTMMAYESTLTQEFWKGFSLRELERPETDIPSVPEMPTEPDTAPESKLVTVGMVAEDALMALVSAKIEYVGFGISLYYEDPDGMNAVAWMSWDGEKIVRVDTVTRAPQAPTRETFEAFEFGTPLLDVIRTVGIPTGGSSTMDYLDFECADGSRYRVYINERMTLEDGTPTLTGEWYVTAVSRLE